MRANPKSMAAGLLKHVSSNSCRVKVPQTNKTWTRLVTVCAVCPHRSDYPATPAMLTARQFLTVCDPEHCYFSGLGTSTSKGRMGLGYGGAFRGAPAALLNQADGNWWKLDLTSHGSMVCKTLISPSLLIIAKWESKVYQCWPQTDEGHIKRRTLALHVTTGIHRWKNWERTKAIGKQAGDQGSHSTEISGRYI